jgi:beta-mannosidase
MRYIELSKGWRFRAADESKWKPASVPGCVHLDLLDSGVIEDPFSGDNHERMQWISEREWVYECRFYAPKIKADEKAHLCCSGLDTLASIELNGEMVGNADNMFRSWRFDISTLINEGDNILTVHFASPVEYIKNRQSERFLGDSFGNAPIPGRGWLRKMSNAFGTYWNPPLVTAGIWRAIGIEIFDHPRIDNITVQQHRCETGEVRLKISAKIEGFTVRHKQLNISARISCRTTIVCEARQPLKKNGVVTFEHTISNPQLWWPNGLGSQPLYEIVVEITAARKTLHSAARRIGLRTLTLERKADKDGESFQFTVNGVPFFAKGSTWMPPDVLLCRPTRLEYAHFIKSVSSSNMNMLRVWGGGIYEQDWFYDLCDEHGICVWQDFMFACPEYPVFDAAWLENVRAEAAQNIVRLRDHACLALWCGNNEYAMDGADTEGTAQQRPHHEDYARLFDDLLPSLVAELDPGRDYWPVSPHGSLPGADTHADIQGWDADAPAGTGSPSRSASAPPSAPQSFPEPSVIKAFTQEETCDPASPLLLHHQRFSRNCPIPSRPLQRIPSSPSG